MRVAILIFLTLFFSNCNKQEKSEVRNDDVYGEYEIADSSKSKGGTEPVVHVVEIVQMEFVPDVVNIHEGDTVLWVNNDTVIHDVTEQYDKKWTSSPIPFKGILANGGYSKLGLLLFASLGYERQNSG